MNRLEWDAAPRFYGDLTARPLGLRHGCHAGYPSNR
jgi:hypothetical protein